MTFTVPKDHTTRQMMGRRLPLAAWLHCQDCGAESIPMAHDGSDHGRQVAREKLARLAKEADWRHETYKYTHCPTCAPQHADQ